MPGIGHHEIILSTALKEIQREWAATAEGWQDSARKEFEDACLLRLLAAAKTAAGAMGEISRLMEQAVRECT